jgi:general secretion pathway protein J
MSSASPKRARGFTLVEILLATALLAAGLGLAFATLRAAGATAERGEALAQRNEHMRAVLGFLRARIASARPVAFDIDADSGLARRFAGSEREMAFVAVLPDYLGRGGPHLHRLQVERDGEGLRLVVGFELVQGGRVVEQRQRLAPEVLAEGLRAVHFEYRGLDDRQQPGPWQSRWQVAEALPLQVRISITGANGDAWPPLLVALPLAGRYAMPVASP